MQKIKDYSLYLVITEEYGNGRSALEIAASAIIGGIDIIQMREKNKSRPELIKLGKKLSRLCKNGGVTFIVNDDPSIAKEVDADGVHLGQEDIKKHSVGAARKVLGRDKTIGISTHSIETFRKACAEDVNYIAYGPVFPTEIKDNYAGTENVGKVVAMTKKPVFFIGGISPENVDSLLEKGARNISLIRAITQAGDVESAVKSFKKKMEIASPTPSKLDVGSQ
ncbi:MAG: thiamine phosphate synthase [Candidatus Omnitrophica bacterium]|nr:thiamine phosphate synthase [Candidatus Omnitrophota bacterium]